MQLTKNFNTDVDTKITGGINWEQYPFKDVARRLAENLQTIRDYLGTAITVTSGYRSAEKNASLSGSSKTSQHLLGEAVDFVVKGRPEALQIIHTDVMAGKLKLPHPCSQLILESNGKVEWLHMGLFTDNWASRQKAVLLDHTTNAMKAATASKRLTHCEFLVTSDTKNYRVVGYKYYGDFA